MVRFQEDTISEDQSNAMALASSFRAASDDDTLSVMNAMSAKSHSGDDSLKFYIVPATWFRKAFPVLTSMSPDEISDKWREQIGPISNAELVDITERQVSSDDDETSDNKMVDVSDVEMKRFDRMHRRSCCNGQNVAMRPGLVHKKDFFFLGPSAWMVVKEKFDFDGYELARPAVPRSSNTLAIRLSQQASDGNSATMIDIPASGRFAYERVISKDSASAIVPEEDDSNFESSFVFVQRESSPLELQDENKPEDEAPVLLLPASTTTESAGNNDGMDVDDDNENCAEPPVFAGRKRQANGLANLGNTCFMNSSIQCLAHTDPLRKYFLTGEYARDLNKKNPLGTGGELATQFATLIGDMWGVKSKRRSVIGSGNSSHYSEPPSGAIYPRNFKYCLGKHAEQFVGYDQHDSQELATYLLDALHEDTNRVTKKPYVEIPEQGEDESDEDAADKAWKLHQKREDSRVLENFMGQVKSRLECCKEGCNRVSTTYDPFMYLSVPIPGSNDKTVPVTFVPLDPQQKLKKMSLTLNKSASMSDLMTKMNEKLVESGLISQSIPLEDLVAVDIWSHEVFSWYQHTSEIERLRDNDKTFIYQLRTLADVQEESKPKENSKEVSEDIFGTKSRTRKYNLDIATLSRLNANDGWQKELENYVQSPMLLLSLFNPKRGSIEERIQFCKKLETFIDLCHREVEEAETSGTKRTRDGGSSESKTDRDEDSPMDEKIQGLIDRSDASTSFKGARTRHDVAILEWCASKFRQYILNSSKAKESYKDGIVVQIVMRRQKTGSSNYSPFAQPILMRISGNMAVYELRRCLADRLSRSLKCGSGQSSLGFQATNNSESAFGSPGMLAMRQVPLFYEKKGSDTSWNPGSNARRLGMIARSDEDLDDGSPRATMALSTDDAENQLVAEAVGPNSAVFVDWSEEMYDRFFDETEANSEENVGEPEEKEDSKHVTVMDCIDKYCQKEQLEESEMWYCNKCKDHVRAWKQFHLFRVPPILIVHLKRFHYSASTHRRNKITTYIDFPLEGLDLTHLVPHYKEGHEPIYDCYAVSNHYGNLGGGHYTAYIQGDDGSWLHYDDSRVTTNLQPKEVVTEAAYVLYYRRRDVEVAQDPILDNQTYAIVVDHNIPSREPSEGSSNHSATAVNGDTDIMAVDGEGSMRTSSPVSDLGSFNADNDESKDNDTGSSLDNPNSGDFPLQ